MDNLDPQVRDVYAEYGIVMGEAQLVERYMVYIVVAAHEGQSTERLTPAEYDGILDQLSVKTFGGLIHRVKQSFDVPATFQARLVEAQHLRNWIAHHYFRDRAEAFQTETGRANMIRELDEIGDRLHELYEFFDDLLTGWMVHRGSSSRELIERFNKVASEALTAAAPDGRPGED